MQSSDAKHTTHGRTAGVLRSVSASRWLPMHAISQPNYYNIHRPIATIHQGWNCWGWGGSTGKISNISTSDPFPSSFRLIPTQPFLDSIQDSTSFFVLVFRSLNLILFTLLVRLILRTSPHHMQSIPTFTLTIYHSLSLSLQMKFKTPLFHKSLTCNNPGSFSRIFILYHTNWVGTYWCVGLLADRTNSRAYAIQCVRLSSSVTLCIVAKRCVLVQKLLLTAYRKSCIRNIDCYQNK